MKTLFIIVILLFPTAARAQVAPAGNDELKGAKPVADDEADEKPEGDNPWGLTFKQKAAAGNQDYRMSDTSLDVDMPHDLDLNADVNVYKNSTSSMTPTVTFGAGWAPGRLNLTGSYAITTLANDYEADAVDLAVSWKTDSREFRTLFGFDFTETYHRNYIYIPRANPKLPEIKNQQDLNQKSPTISVSQRFFDDLDAKVSLSRSAYSRNILAYTTALNRTKTPAQRAFGRADGNLLGVVDGFPDWSAKFGLNYGFDAVPLTLRSTYEDIHLENTAQGTDQTSDSFTYAADYDVVKWLTLTAEYDHTRQTSQPDSDVYAGRLTLSF
jgi:hypothetical protein